MKNLRQWVALISSWACKDRNLCVSLRAVSSSACAASGELARRHRRDQSPPHGCPFVASPFVCVALDAKKCVFNMHSLHVIDSHFHKLVEAAVVLRAGGFLGVLQTPDYECCARCSA